MSINKLALFRYKILDDCLRNKQRKWTLEDLITRVSDELYEREGIEAGVSKRTIQADLQLMRSDKLGYNAPIVVREKKFYSYKDENYSITKVPITSNDVRKMNEIVGVLKQLNGFSYFDEMSEMITRLENNLYARTSRYRNCVQFEDNKQLVGLQHITPLYSAILNEQVLSLTYRSFKARQPQQIIISPYLLKEYRNRWFLIAKEKEKPHLQTLALDRIIAFEETVYERFVEHPNIDFDSYYSDLIGVSRSEKDLPQAVTLWIDKANAPYVRTKPLHNSQIEIEERDGGLIIRIKVIINFELEREILGLGEYAKVISPRALANRIGKRLGKAFNAYQQKFIKSKLIDANIIVRKR